MKPIKYLILSLLFSGLAALPTYAHRVGVPITTIEWNDRSDRWEIIHRLSAHDIEDAFGPGTDLGELSQLAFSQTMAEYVQSKFDILAFMSLRFVGAEIDGDTVWVYYELIGRDQFVILRSQLLLETEVTASALVNIETSQGLQSFTFDAETGWTFVKLERPITK